MPGARPVRTVPGVAAVTEGDGGQGRGSGRAPRRWATPFALGAALALAMAVVPVGPGAAEAPAVFVDFAQASAANPFGGDPLAHPEGIVADGGDGFFVTGYGNGHVYHVTAGGQVSLFAELPAAPDGATAGIARAADGTLYVAHEGAPADTGLWRIGPGGGSHADDPAVHPDAPRKLFPLDPSHAVGTPNGVTVDRRGDLFVSDSQLGRIWKVSPTSTPEQPVEQLWAEGLPFAALISGVGVNGLQAEHHGDDLYAVNFDQGTVLRLSTLVPATVQPPTTIVWLSPLLLGRFFDGITIDGDDEVLYVTAAGQLSLFPFPLAPGHEILAVDVRDCAARNLPAVTRADRRVTTVANDPLLNVVTDVVLSPDEAHLYAVDLDFLGFGAPGGAVLRVPNGPPFPACP